MLVSVIVKALNEEQRIAACLEAALLALDGLDAEVILVDSISTDKTVEIARGYPVRIVQFDQVEHRGCGAAVELGWRHSRGQFIYVLDADMLLQTGFLQSALAYLAAHPQVAAAGGNLIDTRLNNVADRQRARLATALVEPCRVGELGGGGLYRRVAVEQAGYLAHRSLQAYEEAELGARLRSMGWTLVRLPQTAVLHEGHDESSWQMLVRLWANGRAKSAATFLHSAFGKPWFRLVVRKLAHILVIPLMHTVALLLALAVGWQQDSLAALCAWAGFWLVAALALAAAKRSMQLALWHLFLWHYWAAGTITGLGARTVDPHSPIPAHEIGTSTSLHKDPHAA
jgi:glycosyltransferase involved in cell wall biosynthesis